MDWINRVFSREDPFGMDLMIKLLTIVVLTKPYVYLGHVKVPFIGSMYSWGEPGWVESLVFVCIIAGSLLILSNLLPKLGAAFMILGILTTILGCQPCYADSKNFIVAIYFLYLLSDKNIGFKLIQWQMVILYASAAVNKLFETDWLTGQYMDNWMSSTLAFQPYINFASFFPHLMLGKLISWSVIISEGLMALCFTRKQWFSYGVFLGLMVHGLSIVASNFVFGSFVAAVMISFISFINWPESFEVNFSEKSYRYLIAQIFICTDLYGYFDFKSSPGHRMEVTLNGKHKLAGFRAWQIFLIHHPLVHILVVVYIISEGYLGPNWIKGMVMILLALAMLPTVGKILNRRYLKPVSD